MQNIDGYYDTRAMDYEFMGLDLDLIPKSNSPQSTHTHQYIGMGVNICRRAKRTKCERRLYEKYNKIAGKIL